MSRIYIRHAEKLFANGKSDTYKHDPGIVETERSRISLMAKSLVSKYGFPVALVCSPYLRTRQTALELANEVERLRINLEENKVDTEADKTIVYPVETKLQRIPIYVDVNISEYLGNRADEELDVTKETHKYNPPHPETFRQLDHRVKFHNTTSSSNFWYITHGLVIKRLIHHLAHTHDYTNSHRHEIQPLSATVITHISEDNHKIKIDYISPP